VKLIEHVKSVQIKASVHLKTTFELTIKALTNSLSNYETFYDINFNEKPLFEKYGDKAKS